MNYLKCLNFAVVFSQARQEQTQVYLLQLDVVIVAGGLNMVEM